MKFSIGMAGILIGVGLSWPALGEDAAVEPELMFVQTGAEFTSDASTIRLIDVTPMTLWFSDRPFRLAGHIGMEDWFEEWTDSAGSDNFSNDPPNATLSVYEPGNAEPTLAVVEISDPVMEGNVLTYTYAVVDGVVPAAGGEVVLFIDWIGVGGGVGPGYHGVGLGTRGAGVLPGRCPAGAINVC